MAQLLSAAWIRAPSGFVTVASTDAGISSLTEVSAAVSAVQTAGKDGSVARPDVRAGGGRSSLVPLRPPYVVRAAAPAPLPGARHAEVLHPPELCSV